MSITTSNYLLTSSEEEEKPSRRVNRRREPQRMTGEHTPISLIEPPRYIIMCNGNDNK